MQVRASHGAKKVEKCKSNDAVFKNMNFINQNIYTFTTHCSNQILSFPEEETGLGNS